MANHKKTIAVIQGDITQIAADAIVNSAHESLLPGAGVSGAIHARAGSVVEQECRALYEQHGKQKAGTALPTQAGALDAQYIIHAVGPRWQGGHANEEELLARTYKNIIATAGQLHLRTVSIPAISVGIFAFPLERAAEITIHTLVQALQASKQAHNVLLVCFSPDITQAYEHALEQAQGNESIDLVSLAPSF